MAKSIPYFDPSWQTYFNGTTPAQIEQNVLPRFQNAADTLKRATGGAGTPGDVVNYLNNYLNSLKQTQGSAISLNQ